MDLQDYRVQINKIDDAILSLFKERMDISRQIALFKKERGLPALDVRRESEKLADMGEKAGEELRPYAQILYTALADLSRAHQGNILNNTSAIRNMIEEASERARKIFPRHARIACQGIEGVEGDYAQMACDRLFSEPDILYCASSDRVFSAIRDDLCEYGILPLENGAADSTCIIYNLIKHNNCKIVRSLRLKRDEGTNYPRYLCISKNLEVYPGADRSSVMLTVAHKPGVLYRVLGSIYAQGVNIMKLDSCPVPERDCEFMIYIDLEMPVCSDNFIQLLCELENMGGEFHYLGSYQEIR